MYFPTLKEFQVKAKHGNTIPVYRPILADMETPVSAFYKLMPDDYAFLLESVEGGEKVARYSFLGSQPSILFQSKGNEVTIEDFGKREKVVKEYDDPLRALEELMQQYQPVSVDGLPEFHGGAVGYMTYDMVRFVEELPDTNEDELQVPDCFFMIADTILVFDHVNHQIKVVANAHIDGDVDSTYSDAIAKIDVLVDKLISTSEVNFVKNIGDRSDSDVETIPDPPSNFTKSDYEEAVRRAKEYIAAGDIIQVVPSQRFSRPVSVDSFDIYRALRVVNPSPYMYYLKYDSFEIVGASPEMMVRVENGLVQTRPIAGTLPRGKTDEEDRELEEELISDPKERAEHVMLVDLGRNDLGRVCEYHTVEVTDLMIVERFSHVMHIVSHVVGRLRENLSAFDVIRACLPAGTLSGAPKIRAMEIIEELESTRRGPYGGTVGYFSFSGSADTAITIRTAVIKDGTAYVQAGGGVVADSIPENEYYETVSKAWAMLTAIEMAQQGLLHHRR
ncbi:anthranilate synthase component I [Candidatus Poribacteria bacterium]|nr:MAG: anthranilate synthase component I [Candidatus Poribacteria bacterium]